MHDHQPFLRRGLVACACAVMPIAGCFTAMSYSAPNGARLTTTPLAREAQQGRWACAGKDLVLAGDTLHELNAGYAMTNVERIEGASVFHTRVDGLVTMFAIPDDRTQPARIELQGSVTLAQSNILGTVEQGVASSFECPPAAPVTVW